MNMQSDRHTWFVLLDGQRRGPIAYDDLARAAKEGLISGDTPVWRAGWKNWHPARSVKGLVIERGPGMERRVAERQVIERQAHERSVHERPVIEAPLAPDDTPWNEEGHTPEVEAYHYAPPQHREARRPSQQPQPHDMVALRWDQRSSEDTNDHIFAEEWRGVLADQRPVPDRSRAVVRASVPARIGRRPGTLDIDDVTDVDYRPVQRGDAADGRPSGIAAFLKRAAIGMSAMLVLGVGGLVLVKTGALPGKLPGKTPAMASPDLPPAVASVPAVIALQRNDPDAFERFKRRYLDSAANPGSDDVKTLTRNALRKSVKHLLAIAPGDVLLELTETSLAYLQGLQVSNPESCVWLSGDNKGARLTSNLARDLPGPFNREMMLLERIASTNTHIGVAAMSDEEARPFFDRVVNSDRVVSTVRRQNIKSDLQTRDRLDPSEFAPYCALVIAFYQAVLDLPRDDKINVLRNLYAKAAENADSDLRR
jgi:hypothetical protein